MNKKVLSVLLAVILSTSVIAGCNNEGGSSDSTSSVESADSASDTAVSSEETTTSTFASSENVNSTAAVQSSKPTVTGTSSKNNQASQTPSKEQNTSSTFMQKEETSLSIKITKTGNLQLTADYYNDLPIWVAPEMFPVNHRINGSIYEIISTSKSGVFRQKAGVSMLDKDHLDLTTGFMLTYPNYTNAKGEYRNPDNVSDNCYWRRNYNGSFDSFIRNDIFYSVNHCENKNEIINGAKYANTVKPNQYYFNEDYSRVENGSYVDAYQNYFAFVTLSYSRVGDLMKTGSLVEEDTGPVIWPQDGYLNFLDEKASDGIRHPSVYVEGDYIYMFYLENNDIMLARSKMSSSGKPGPFMKYYNGGFTSKGLPNGFDKNDKSFLSAHSDPATPLFEYNGAYRFHVRKLKGTDYYLGVQHGVRNGDQWGIYLRVSKNLTNWSDAVLIPGTETDGWSGVNLKYAQLYATDLVNSMEIDPNNFVIAGTHDHNGSSVPQILPMSIKIVKK